MGDSVGERSGRWRVAECLWHLLSRFLLRERAVVGNIELSLSYS